MRNEMIRKIRDIIEKCGISVWRINESHTQTAELYYIKKKLDMPRIKEMVKCSVTVFHDSEADGKKLRGEATVIIDPCMDDERIEERIKSAYNAASFALNPFYELADPVQCELVKSSSDLSQRSVRENVQMLADAAFSADVYEDAFINSIELFVSREYEHIVASNGLDVCFENDSADGEMVVQCISPSDVEQFREFSYDRLDTDALRKKVADAINDVRARARAKSSPKAGTYDILLKDEDLAALLGYYAERSHASYIYPGYSQWKVSDMVQGDDVRGARIDIEMSSNEPFSEEGIPMKNRKLISGGRLEMIHGSTRLSRYLGTEPTGEYGKMICSNADKPLCDMVYEGVLEPVSFSDFQMDSMDGHFSGEIRLAFLHHADGSTEELTGGSINGAFIELQKDLTFSNERYSSMTYEGPAAVLIKGVAVAGE